MDEKSQTHERGECDLPLSSNFSEAQVHHYILSLKCDFRNKCFHGCTTIFFTQQDKTNSHNIDHHSSENKNCSSCFTTIYEDHIECKSFHTEPSYLEKSSEETESAESTNEQNIKESNLVTSLSNKRKSTDKESSILPVKQMKQSSSLCTDADMCSDLLQESLDSGVNSKDFTLVLDCHKIEIQSISEENVTTDIDVESFCSPNWTTDINQTSESLLQYDLGDQCIKIKVPCLNYGEEKLRAIRILYKTTTGGQSLKWTKDQDGNDCVYTHGHWINNRSLFPSQDVPEALTTWQAYVTVPQGMTVIMSGDQEPQIKDCHDNMDCFYFWTAFPMPSSTLSLAVGHWKECKDSKSQNMSSKETIPYRMYGPETLMTSMTDIHRYIPQCLKEVTAVLGPHPLKRQDILVVPSSFDSLGMASPSVLYISQSLLHPDLSMFYRLAHEVCHTWFGIVIGPSDWTEEWLTEGFCTYLEDIIHTRVLKLDESIPEILIQKLGMISEKEECSVRSLREHVKFRTLNAEVQSSEESLLTLKPCCDEPVNKTFVKNGMNPEKKYLQVHYLKGYFLLRYLERIAGLEKFLGCLNKYVNHFHGKLVSSEEVLQFFINESEEIRATGITVSEISSVWLECSGIPSPISQMVEADDEVVSPIKIEVQIFCIYCKRRKTELDIDSFKEYGPDELLLFLELLLDEMKIPLTGLSSLKKKYQIDKCNAEIKHRWCELVIKRSHDSCRFHGDIQKFLLEHQGMGVYLYGELMLSGRKALIKLAHKCFQQLQHSMSTDNYSTVHAMLFGD